MSVRDTPVPDGPPVKETTDPDFPDNPTPEPNPNPNTQPNPGHEPTPSNENE